MSVNWYFQFKLKTIRVLFPSHIFLPKNAIFSRTSEIGELEYPILIICFLHPVNSNTETTSSRLIIENGKNLMIHVTLLVISVCFFSCQFGYFFYSNLSILNLHSYQNKIVLCVCLLKHCWQVSSVLFILSIIFYFCFYVIRNLLTSFQSFQGTLLALLISHLFCFLSIYSVVTPPPPPSFLRVVHLAHYLFTSLCFLI